MKSWKLRILVVSFVAVAMLFGVSGLTAMAQVTTDFHGYVSQDLDGDGLIDTCSTCFDTDGDGLVDTCYENEGFADRIGQPIGLADGSAGLDGDLGNLDDPAGFDDGSDNFDDSSSSSDEGPIGADAGKDGDEPIAADAGKSEEE